MSTHIAATLAVHPELAAELYLLASEIVDDFEDYGPVLQANEDGVYDEATAINRLQSVRNALIERLRQHS